jgi:hypothetical protein
MSNNINQEMAISAQYGVRSDGVRVIPGDDITKAAWRFERRTLEMPLEQSEAWKTFALRNNMLDPFQIASSDNVQYAKPDQPMKYVSKSIAPVSIDLSEHEDLTIFRFDIYNESQGAHILMETSYFQLGKELSVSNSHLTAEVRRSNVETWLDIKVIDPYISYEFTVDLIVFRPREMTLPTGEIIPAGRAFEARNYPAVGANGR